MNVKVNNQDVSGFGDGKMIEYYPSKYYHDGDVKITHNDSGQIFTFRVYKFGTDPEKDAKFVETFLDSPEYASKSDKELRQVLLFDSMSYHCLSAIKESNHDVDIYRMNEKQIAKFRKLVNIRRLK